MATVLKQEQYPQLDMVAVHQRVRAFSIAKAEQAFDFATGLQERIDGASQTISEHTRSLLSECAALEVVVSGAGFSELLNQWGSIKVNGNLSEVLRSAGFDQVKSVYLKKVEHLKEQTAQRESRLTSLLDDVAAINLEHYSESLFSFDAEKLKQYEALNDRLQIKIGELEEDKKTLEAAIKVLESRTWWDHVKDILPTGADIDVAVKSALVGTVDAGVIKLALDRVTKYIDLIEGGRKFSDMIRAKLLIVSELKSQTMELKKNKKEMEPLLQRAENLENHVQLLSARDLWVTTIKSIRASVQQFMSMCELMSLASEEAIAQAPQQQADFVSFLRSLNK